MEACLLSNCLESRSKLVIILFGLVSLCPTPLMSQKPDKEIDPDVRLLQDAITQKQKMILYETDHFVLARELRNFGEQMRQTVKFPENGGVTIFSDEPSIPPSLKILKPTSLRVLTDRVEMEFGGAFLHFGVVAFVQGAGDGEKQLAEGMWFYSENKRVPPP
jgi:hypothetical protein